MEAPTARLLWAAARAEPDLDAVRSALSAGADLNRAAESAVSQRVSPLLWRALSALPDVAARRDEPWASTLAHDAARCRAHALIVLARLGSRALGPLAEAGTTALVFKGAALADRYREPGLRPMDDVDLVLPPEQLDAGVAALERAGWRQVAVPSAHHEVILVHDELPGLPLELHRALATWRERSNHMTTADLWSWRTPGSIQEQPVFVLPLEEEIVALAAHAAKPFHTFDRLIWTVDLAVVIDDAARRGSAVDWDRVGTLAEAARCRTGLAVALTQVARLGQDSPSALRNIPADARGRALLPLLSGDWPLVDRTWGTRTRLRYALVDDWRQRITLLAGQIILNGPARVPRNTLELAARGAHRWWRLRSDVASTPSSAEDRHAGS